jgi:hypothetical protein
MIRPGVFYYILAELSDIEEKWLCNTCYFRYYSARPVVKTMTEERAHGKSPDFRCRECGV